MARAARHRRPSRPRRVLRSTRLRVSLVLLLVIGCVVAVALDARTPATRSAQHIAAQPLPATRAPVPPRTYVTRTITLPAGYRSAGRQFELREPVHAGPARPLVLLLHGLYQDPALVERATHASAFSDARDFTLAYPIGIGKAWNAGGCCERDSADDVGYLVDVVHYAATLTPVDRSSVYVWGFSNGAMMAWRAVCQADGVFAGAGVMSGALLVACPRVVHVVHLHGLADVTVPYRGGPSSYLRTVLPDSASEGARLVRGSTLEVRLLEGVGHDWPTLRRGGVDALAVMWDGLRRYRVSRPTIFAPTALVAGATPG